MNTVIVVVVIALSLCCTVIGQTVKSGFSIEEYTAIIANSRRLFEASCVYLVVTRQPIRDQLRTAWLVRGLSQRSLAVAVVTFDNLEETGRCEVSRPLNVIIADTEGTSSVLAKLPKVPSYATWLVFVEEPLDNFLSTLVIPFDCEFLLAERLSDVTVILSEVYHVREDLPLNRKQFATWTLKTGIVRRVNGSLKERRSNLQGLVLRAGARHNPPNVVIKYDSNQTAILSGYFPEVWRVLEASLNFTTTFEVSNMKRQGSLLPNGTWTGLMGMILRDEVDLSINDFTLVLERRKDFDYLLPLMVAVNRVLIRRPTSVNLSWDNFLDPFSMRLWLALVGSILVLGISLALVYKTGRYFGNEESQGPPVINLSEAMVFHYGLICQQGHDITPRAMSGRIIYIIGALTSIIVMAAYSAKLISYLTVQTIDIPVNSFEELLALKYEIGVVQTSGQFKSFQTTNHPLLKRVYSEMVLKNNSFEHLPKTFEEGLERVCMESSYAMIASYKMTLGMWENVSCKVTHLPKITLPVKYAMLIPQEFPYKNVINKRLMRLRETGVLVRIRSKIWPPVYEDDPSVFNSVALESVTPMLTLVVLGICSGFLVLGLEILICKFVSKRNNIRDKTMSDNLLYFHRNVEKLEFGRRSTVLDRRPRRNYVLYG